MGIRFLPYGLQSSSGFVHLGDTIFIRTAQQIRAFLDFDHEVEQIPAGWAFIRFPTVNIRMRRQPV